MLAGAPSAQESSWHAIDWRQAMHNVRRLQVRIVKATQTGRWNKVKALQHLLRGCPLGAWSGRVLAVRRVTENQGKRTAGVDGELWETPDQKMAGVAKIKQRHYKVQPLKRVYILKSDGKSKRPLGIPTMTDRAHQALHLLGLDPVAATTGDTGCPLGAYGFQREHSLHDAIGHLFNILRQKGSAVWILEADIKACFDKLSHRWLLEHIPADKHSLRQWLKAGYIEQGLFHATEEGSPQGGVISPVIANLALDGLQALLRRHFHPRRTKVYLVGYADDFVITAKSRELLEEEVLPLVRTFLAERGLTLSTEKTVITHIDDGFDFLGKTLRKQHGKLVITPSRKSQQAIRRKIRRLIRQEGRQLSALGLIHKLNPVIRGWANSQRHVVSGKAFKQLDHNLDNALWQWARRRHPEKTTAWIRQTYFQKPHMHHRIFHADTTNEEGEKVQVQLFRATHIPIRRHVMIRLAANPYDPAWEPYFEQRAYKHILDVSLWDRPRLRYHWFAQKGICPVCQQRITQETGWEIHHILYRIYGGGDELDNRVLLHPNCHRQVHHPDFNGPSLRPSITDV
jgi:RNA-directed DNA polymerase